MLMASCSPRHFGHDVVGDHEVERPGIEFNLRLAAAEGGLDDVAVVLQMLADELAEDGFVVHDQNAQRISWGSVRLRTCNAPV